VIDYDVKVVCGCYSDYKRAGTLSPAEVTDIPCDADVDGILVDTAVKDGKSTFDFMGVDELLELKDELKSRGLLFALAGGISWRDIEKVKEVKPDVLGVRTMVCENGRYSRIREHLVRRLVEAISR